MGIRLSHPSPSAAKFNVCVSDALNPRCQSLFDSNQTAGARLRIVFPSEIINSDFAA
jgi:hypothetical protein